ncbi:MAG TPA: ABC transporter substrate-binding protein [Bordetella sp.]
MKQPFNIASMMSSTARLLACGALLASSALAHATTLDEAKKALPDAIKSSGTLRVATSLQWAPFAYSDENSQAAGIDIELVKLLAQKLGLKATFDDLKFPSIVPGISTGRYDIGVDQIGITEEREKVVDMIPYFRSGFGLLVKKGSAPLNINKLCGHTLALTQGSSQVQIIGQMSTACTASGQKEIAQLFYPNSADTYMAVANGRGEGFIADHAVAVYIAKLHGSLDVMPEVLDGKTLVAGIAVGKQLPTLKQALQVALQAAVQDGSYKALLTKYGVPDSAYTEE